jgi:serine/threonine protein kinase
MASTVGEHIPEKLGTYRVLRLLSTGGMAKVYEGRRESLAGVAATVAIKIIDPERAQDDRFKRLFIQEAKVSSNLRHQNLVQIQDFDQVNGQFFLVMEYVEGMTLRSAIKRSRKHGIPLPQPLIAEVGRQVCDGLNHAHCARTPDDRPLGLVHRDIKPSNLMLNPQGVVKVLDFGVSHASILQERPGAVRGTWGYMAPEQAAGEAVTPRTDLFGLAVVLYEMASLKPMFTREEKLDHDVFRQLLISDEAARRAAQLPKEFSELSRILVRALQRDSEARYASAESLGRALSELVPDLVKARRDLVAFEDQIRRLSSGEERELSPYIGEPSEISSPSAEEEDNRQIGLVLTLILPVVIALLLFGVFRISQFFQSEPEPPLQVVESLPSPEELVPVEIPEPEPVVKQESKPEPEKKKRVRKRPVKQVAPVAKSPSEKPTVTDTVSTLGMMTVSSDTTAKVFIDGKFIRNAPLYRYSLKTGSHQVHLAHSDGRVKRFEVTVQENQESIFLWSFYENRWLRQQP